jgi:asparagine synthase (glutamine-hydrolysing)
MYTCSLRLRGAPAVRGEVVGRLLRGGASAESLQTMVEGPFAAVATAGRAQLRPQLARWRHIMGVGDVRLDNRVEVARIAGVDASGPAGDLALVLAALDAAGESCVPRLLGDFAFVAWDARAQKLLAVRDAFGVKPLYQRDGRDMLLFASNAGTLQQGEEYDHDYIVAHLSGNPASVDNTIWRGVRAVGSGTLVRQRGTVQRIERYWSPARFTPAESGDESANCARFRDLLEEAVRTRVEDATQVWAHLSGGLDSSSIVAMASGVCSASHVAGTVTVVDSLGDGDERLYSDAVVQQYNLRNEQVHDYWAWQDDGEAPPLTDQPTAMYPFYARDRRIWHIVRDSGSRVLLSGMGADHYLHGSLDYITDLAGSLRVRSALHEALHWAVATRQSFWGVARHWLLEPFLPALLRHGSAAAAPPWLLQRADAHRTGPAAAANVCSSRFAARIAAEVASLPAWYERWPFGDDVEMRYPFLYRPLVEMSLALPATQRVRPHARKWILRQAARDILPERVRTRSTKGGIDARILWSLQREQSRIDTLLRDPILAQLGCIDPEPLRRAVDQARRGVPVHNVHLFSALALESWLAVRAGTWNTHATLSAA